MKQTFTAYIFDAPFSGMPKDDAKKLTHANYSFALIKNGQADVSHWKNEAALLQLMKEAPHLSINLSIGGWAADGFSQASATAEGRERLAASIINLLRKYNFKGADLDWEYPADSIGGIVSSPDDVQNYPLFIHLLRQKLNALTVETGVDYSLTMAVGCTQKCVDNLSCPVIVDDIDQINIMSYDLAPWGEEEPATHHTLLYPGKHPVASISASTAVEAFHQAGIPYEKLVLGVAFYGRRHLGVERGTDNGLYQTHTSDFPAGIKYHEIKKRLAGTGERYWDDTAKAVYLYDEADKLFVTYDDPETIRCKTEYVIQKKLGGVMFWEYGDKDTDELLEALYQGMNSL